MEGSGFGGDLENLRVSGDECLSCQMGVEGHPQPWPPTSLLGSTRTTWSPRATWRAWFTRGARTVWDEPHGPARTTGAARQGWDPWAPRASGRSTGWTRDSSQGHPVVVGGPVLTSPAGLPAAGTNSWDLTGSSGSSRKRWRGWATRAQRRAGERPLSHVHQEHVTAVPQGSWLPWHISERPQFLGWGAPFCSFLELGSFFTPSSPSSSSFLG